MKFQIAAIAALAAGALAAPSPAPSAWSFKSKRAVEAFAEQADAPLTEAEAIAARGADDMGLIASAAYDHLVHLASQGAADPEAFYEMYHIQTGGEGQVQARAEAEKRWCLRPGHKCWKRSVEQQDELAKRWCFRPRQPCWKVKRAAEAILTARQGDDVAEEACADGDEQCSNAKRHLDNLHQAAREIVEVF
ncbi:hypothetical protein V2A60_001949 [Cordyceps javanica]|uniref:Clock-controlled pheromone ccg-4 n=1 Tax=Cordyceps javanica TaxID=43265 RepID=A0A545VGR6_9HYPO|nr:hypothetical protein IF1G_00846 [Cordyceps javanica]TQW12087.1 hypothetical protein IF2G_00818 [Cordyceps javanica]